MAYQRKSASRELQRTITLLGKARVMIGIPAESTRRSGNGQEISNAVLGYLFEGGAPEINMPARPWLVPGVRSAEGPIAEAMAAGAGKALATVCHGASVGSAQAEIERTLHKVGLFGQNAVCGYITAGIAPPLAASTIRRRRTRTRNRRSATSTTPLIDTGQFLNSITYTVKI